MLSPKYHHYKWKCHLARPYKERFHVAIGVRMKKNRHKYVTAERRSKYLALYISNGDIFMTERLSKEMHNNHKNVDKVSCFLFSGV